MPFIVLLLGVAVFSVLVGGRFFAPFNLSLILQQVTIIGIVGVAQTLVILTAGIDLSVGAIMVLSSVVMGRLGGRLRRAGRASPSRSGSSSARSAAASTACSSRVLQLPPFIVTLGTWSIFGALNTLLFAQRDRSGSRTSRRRRRSCSSWAQPIQIGGARAHLRLDPDDRCWRSSSGTCSTAPPSAATSTRSATIPDAARLAGINTNRMLIAVYTLAGLICALAGWVLIGRIGAVSPHRRRRPPTSTPSPPW